VTIHEFLCSFDREIGKLGQFWISNFTHDSQAAVANLKATIYQNVRTHPSIGR